MDLKISFFF